MSNFSKAITSGFGVLVAGALSAGVGLALTPAHAAPSSEPWTPRVATYSPSATPGGSLDAWTPVGRTEAYAAYVANYGNDGCRADFDQTYRGTKFVTDLPKAAQSEIAWQNKHLPEGPAFIDYGKGNALQLADRPNEVILIGEYEGACK